MKGNLRRSTERVQAVPHLGHNVCDGLLLGREFNSTAVLRVALLGIRSEGRVRNAPPLVDNGLVGHRNELDLVGEALLEGALGVLRRQLLQLYMHE